MEPVVNDEIVALPIIEFNISPMKIANQNLMSLFSLNIKTD